MKQGQYIILVRETESEPWRDCREGPWDDYDDAETFARNEVGAEWIIVRVSSIEGMR